MLIKNEFLEQFNNFLINIYKLKSPNIIFVDKLNKYFY